MDRGGEIYFREGGGVFALPTVTQSSPRAGTSKCTTEVTAGPALRFTGACWRTADYRIEKSNLEFRGINGDLASSTKCRKY